MFLTHTFNSISVRLKYYDSHLVTDYENIVTGWAIKTDHLKGRKPRL